MIPFLQSLYSDENYIPKNDEEMKELLADLELFSLSAHAFHLLKNRNRLTLFPTFAQDVLAEKANHIMYFNLFIKRELAQLTALFELAKIDTLLLKGIAFTERYFGHFSARQTTDIDLLVHPSDIDIAKDCIRQAGFIEDTSNFLGHHLVFSKILGGLTFCVELHRSIGFENTAEINVSRLWENSLQHKEFNHIKELCPQDTFYTICIHSIKDQMLYKHIIDIVHLLVHHGPLIDLPAILVLAEKEKTKQRILTALTIIYRSFPELSQAHPLPYRKKMVYWNDSLIRHFIHDRKSFYYYLFKLVFPLLYMDTWKHRIIHVKELLFPPRTIAEWFTGLPNHTTNLKLYTRLYRFRWITIIKKHMNKKGNTHA